MNKIGLLLSEKEKAQNRCNQNNLVNLKIVIKKCHQYSQIQDKM